MSRRRQIYARREEEQKARLAAAAKAVKTKRKPGRPRKKKVELDGDRLHNPG